MAAGELPREVTGSLWGQRGQCCLRVTAGAMQADVPGTKTPLYRELSAAGVEGAEGLGRAGASLQCGWRAGWLDGSSSPRRMRRCLWRWMGPSWCWAEPP